MESNKPLLIQFIFDLCVSVSKCDQAFLGLFQKEHNVIIENLC